MSRVGPQLSPEKVQSLKDNSVSLNTTRSNNFALNNFEFWRGSVEGVKPLLDYFNEDNIADLNKVLFRFCSEIRRKDGQFYPPLSIKGQIKALWRHCRNNGVTRDDYNFGNEKNLRFKSFWEEFVPFCGLLYSEGVGRVKKQAEVITVDMEKELWTKKAFGAETPIQIRNTVFFYMCKFFGFRAKEELSKLSWDYIEFGKMDDLDTLRYSFSTSKNYSVAALLKNKGRQDVTQILSKEIFGCFQIYKEATSIFDTVGFFKKVSEDGQYFVDSSLSAYALGTYVAEIMRKNGFKGSFSNHSIRRSLCLQADDKGIKDTDIQARTGHRTLASLAVYKGQGKNKVLEVSKALDPFLERNLEAQPSTSNSHQTQYFECKQSCEVEETEKKKICIEVPADIETVCVIKGDSVMYFDV